MVLGHYWEIQLLEENLTQVWGVSLSRYFDAYLNTVFILIISFL